MSSYRMWGGPVVGQQVSHAWAGYGSAIFFEFGNLSPSDVVRRDGTLGNPSGEWTLSNMGAMPMWRLSLRGMVLADTDGLYRPQVSAIRLLIGRRLLSVEIEAVTRSTRLRFTHGFVLTTKTPWQRVWKWPHWVLRRSDGWCEVALRGTTTTPIDWNCGAF
jgi:hypothetical protein